MLAEALEFSETESYPGQEEEQKVSNYNCSMCKGPVVEEDGTETRRLLKLELKWSLKEGMGIPVGMTQERRSGWGWSMWALTIYIKDVVI